MKAVEYKLVIILMLLTSLRFSVPSYHFWFQEKIRPEALKRATDVCGLHS